MRFNVFLSAISVNHILNKWSTFIRDQEWACERYGDTVVAKGIASTLGFSALDISRQADWESGIALPSAENIVALARLYKVSLKTICKALDIDVSGVPDDV